MTEALRRVLQRNLAACLRRQDYAESERLLATLKEEDPLAVETRGLELEYLLGCRRLPEAEALAQQLVRLFPNSARIHYLAGRLAYLMRRHAEAESCFRESDRLHRNWFTQLFLAKTLTQKGDFQEAESILTGLVEQHPTARRDLSWLYERMGDLPRALQEMERAAGEEPNDTFAQMQVRRLRSLCMDPGAVVGEMEALQELGESVDENMLPQYVEGLLRTGKSERARQIVREKVLKAGPNVVVSTAWNCYQLQAYDVAYLLFAAALPHRADDVKFLSALEASARRCHQLDALRALYEQHAPAQPNLFGRLRRLSKPRP